jgi:hypothetical protein
MCEPITPIWIIAYHEAGHAVVAALQRKKIEGDGGSIRFAVPFKYATIRPNRKKPGQGNTLGHVIMSSKYSSGPDLIVLLAGMVVESRFFNNNCANDKYGKYKNCCARSRSDLEQYCELIEHWYPKESRPWVWDDTGETGAKIAWPFPEGSKHQEVFEKNVQRCEEEVERAWPAIHAVAQDLLEKDTLTP